MGQDCIDTLILGASFLGIGAALALERCCVIEKGGLFGAEFVNTYCVNKPGPLAVKTKPGVVFLAELTRRGLVNDEGEIYQAPAVYVLSKFLKENQRDIRLMTEVLDIEKKEGFFVLTLYHIKGFETIRAKRLIDTTTLGINKKALARPGTRKYLNVIMFNPSGNSMPALYHNRLSGIYTYSLEVPVDLSRHGAIEKLCSMEDLFHQNDMKISSIAPEFSYSFSEPPKNDPDLSGESGCFRVPSAARPNLVAAFDDGVALGERIRL